MKLIASSSYLPKKIVMNKEISEKLGVTEEFIEKRTGIKQRYLAENETIEEMVIKATEKLIEKTGGIIQGMSGSPIIQNGKFVGAITHVLVNNPTVGYAVFGDLMLKY